MWQMWQLCAAIPQCQTGLHAFLEINFLINATVTEISSHIKQSADFCTTVRRLVDYEH